MRTLMVAGLVSILAVLAPSSEAKDVYVRGYYRSDGTYVRPHVRSSPDRYRYNNYGPSRTDDQLMAPRTRDADGDGTPNYVDLDDDNDGIQDDVDRSQYTGMGTPRKADSGTPNVSGAPRTTASMPVGNGWVGDNRSMRYYAASCDSVREIPAAFQTPIWRERSALLAGYTAAVGCALTPSAVAPRMMASPQSTAIASQAPLPSATAAEVPHVSIADDQSVPSGTSAQPPAGTAAEPDRTAALERELRRAQQAARNGGFALVNRNTARHLPSGTNWRVPAGGAIDWESARWTCMDMGTDWRLPTVGELDTLRAVRAVVPCGRKKCAVPKLFGSLAGDVAWTEEHDGAQRAFAARLSEWKVQSLNKRKPRAIALCVQGVRSAVVMQGF